MKLAKKLFLISAAFLLVFVLKANAEEINFEKGTFKEILKKAKTEKKIVMIDFYTDWCKWCVELDKKVYTNKDVADFANTKQINWKIDAEKGEGPDLAKKYNVSGYPTIVFVDSKGDEVDRIVGYLPAKDFLKLMKEYNEGVNTMGSLNNKLKKDANDPEANYKIAEKILNNGDDPSKSLPYLKKVVEKDPDNKSGYKDDAVLMLAVADGNIDGIKKFIVDYPTSDRLKNAYVYIAEKYYQNNNPDYENAKISYDKAFEIYGKKDEEIGASYSQFLITKVYGLTQFADATAEDWKKGVEICNECVEFVKGSINEGSVYYYQSVFYNNLGDKDNANTAIDKAIVINSGSKKFKEQKENINK